MHQELREREEVEKELGLVKGWIQDTRGLLLSPSADLESLLQELEVGDQIHKHTAVHKKLNVSIQVRRKVYAFVFLLCFVLLNSRSCCLSLLLATRCPVYICSTVSSNRAVHNNRSDLFFFSLKKNNCAKINDKKDVPYFPDLS